MAKATDSPAHDHRFGIGTWIFGGILLFFIIYIVVFAPECMASFKQRLMGLSGALLAGLLTFFMSGDLVVQLASPNARFIQSTLGKIAARGGGGLGVFLIVIWWWSAQPIITLCSERPSKLHVNVLDEQQHEVSDPELWTSIGLTPTKVSNLWEFEIASSKLPKEGRITIYGTKKTAFLSGQIEVEMGNAVDRYTTLILKRDTSAHIQGTVVLNGNPASGVRVSVYNYESESTTTGEDGKFDLAAHAAVGEEVLLTARWGKYSASEWYPASTSPVRVELGRKTQ